MVGNVPTDVVMGWVILLIGILLELKNGGARGFTANLVYEPINALDQCTTEASEWLCFTYPSRNNCTQNKAVTKRWPKKNPDLPWSLLYFIFVPRQQPNHVEERDQHPRVK